MRASQIREQVPDLNDTLKRLSALGLVDPDSVEDTRRVIFSRRSFDTVPIRLREEMGLTQERFAKEVLKMSWASVAKYETTHPPKRKQLLRLAQIAASEANRVQGSRSEAFSELSSSMAP